jgi:nitronate monooxygenase
MALPELLRGRLALPVIAAPMFLVSSAESVVAQCTAGVVGSLPALNARTTEMLEDWIVGIQAALAGAASAPDTVVAPFAVNIGIHPANKRVEPDIGVCVRHKVPIVITSLRASPELVQAVHAYGGIVLHDVTTVRHARKALEAGVDGLVLVAAGAGGHGGALNPMALAGEVRVFYDGLLVLAGALSSGGDVLAAQAMGCDLAYMGTRFLATTETAASAVHKQMVVDSGTADIVNTAYFSGLPANYLRGSIVASGLDPENLPAPDGADLGARGRWKDIWGAGQGAGNVREILPTRQLVSRLVDEYRAAACRLLADLQR